MSKYQAINIWIGNKLAKVFTIVSEIFDDAARNLERCENCGENVYYGKPCPERESR